MAGPCAAAGYPRSGSGGARWYVVEHDHLTMPSLESARRSLENLRAMGKA
jgi:hypothetical protein